VATGRGVLAYLSLARFPVAFGYVFAGFEIAGSFRNCMPFVSLEISIVAN
jgi:hypothetical protein